MAQQQTRKNRKQQKARKQKTAKGGRNPPFKLNCHPANKNTVHKDTCYNDAAILQIRDVYNKSHSDQITSNKPMTIYKELRERLTHCTKEDCWIDLLTDPIVSREFDEMLFAHNSPKEWKSNPDSWLSNWDIRDVLKQYEVSHPHFKLLGPSSIDYDTILHDGKCVWEDICRLSLKDLLARKKTKLGVVFNLDKHNQPGSHWVSLFIDCDQKFILYYDSALNTIPSEVNRLIGEVVQQGKNLEKPINFEVIKNNCRHQSTNTECGMYCLFFIITLLTEKLHKHAHPEIYGGGKKYRKLTKKQKINIFTMPGLNDRLMKLFRSIYFNL